MKGMKHELSDLQLRTVKLQGENSPFQNCIFNGFFISLKKKALPQFFLKAICLEKMLYQSSEAYVNLIS